jgi:hypothetical protein
MSVKRLQGEVKVVPLTYPARHPRNSNKGDVAAVVESIKKNGFYGRLHIQAGTHYIWKGNTTYMALLALGAKEVEVEEYLLDDTETLRLLETDNATRDLADYDRRVQLANLEELAAGPGGLGGTTYTLDYITDLHDQIYPDESKGRKSARQNKEKATNADEVPHALFPGEPDYDIPWLLLDQQPRMVELPIAPWGAIKRRAKTELTPKIFHFYTEDWRFKTIWEDPSQLEMSGCGIFVEPNFTVTPEMSRAEAIWQTYRKRWIARYLQARGCLIFADLNVAERHDSVNALGIPVGYNAFATRGYTDRPTECVNEWRMAQALAGRDDVLFLVVGGGKNIEATAKERGWVWVPEWMDTTGVRQHRITD